MDETKAPLAEDPRAVFDRVWQRVMGDAPSPVTWETPSDGSAAASLPAPVPGSDAKPDRPRGDFPTSAGVLGPASADAVPLLQEFIRDELTDYRSYQALARRVGGNPARVLNAMAADELRHAKELSAAYFLISGVRYWPDPGKAPVPTSYLGALRQHFAGEQEGMLAYLAGAEATHDPCLQQLFFSLAQDEWRHACQLRTLVEQA